MNTTEYKQFVLSRAAPPKIVRAGVRASLRTTLLVNAVHGAVGFATEAGEMTQAATPYLLGQQLRPELLKHLREEIGDCLYYLTLAARSLKVKVPNFHKVVKLKQTPGLTLLQIQSTATDMLDVVKKTFYGKELNLYRLTELTTTALDQVYGLHYLLFHAPPEAAVVVNQAKLIERHPKGFNKDNATDRDLDAEGEAAESAMEQHVRLTKKRAKKGAAEKPKAKVITISKGRKPKVKVITKGNAMVKIGAKTKAKVVPKITKKKPIAFKGKAKKVVKGVWKKK